ncbi:MAG: oxidoreductase [Anaerolineaceae bacterium]|nr:oxidoreductase [Anaerolineaceae bacterium]
MHQTVDIALVGAGGYGTSYLRELLHNNPDQKGRLIAVVDPFPERCQFLGELNDLQVPIYPDMDTLFASHKPGLICIASPIQFHAEQTILSLQQGISVLCEKPLCATIQEAQRMAQAEEQTPGFVAIGYQWSFSDAIQALKQDMMQGVLGKPIRLKSRVYWPRPALYYARNQWAGRIALDDGTWVLESPAANAAAHYLHNMLYVLGSTRDTSATPANVQAELFRANPIENYDTASMRCLTTDGVEILFYTTHASQNNINPIFDYEFENATVSYQQDEDSDIVAHFHDGRTKVYGNPFATGMGKIWQCVDALHGGDPVACGIRAATPHTLCINGAQESAPEVVNFPAHLCKTLAIADTQLTYVDGLEGIMTQAYESNCLISESHQVDWAVPGRIVDLINYDHFPMQPV